MCSSDLRCLDLAVEELDEEAIRAAHLVAFHLPMHTATRIAAKLTSRIRELNPRARLCFYGLYAPMNEVYLRRLGADFILGGEFESGLKSLVGRLGSAPPGELLSQLEPTVSIERQQFLMPDRSGLAELSRYAQLNTGRGELRTVGYTEASRGCRHQCRHCPVVPVYRGRFRIVQPERVLEDIRQQVAAGAEHVTFGDPDFFNGVGHALRIVQSLHQEHPNLTYDVTIKIEHLLRNRNHLETLRLTGCLFVTSAVESVDDSVLALLDKGHTREDFVEALRLCREVGLTLHPTFVAFTPWISIAGYRDLLAVIAELDLIEEVSPIQLAIRLLIPAGSKLLELPEVQALVGPFDEEALVHPWRHPEPEVDRLQVEVQALVRSASAGHEHRRQIFSRVWSLAEGADGAPPNPFPSWFSEVGPRPVPYLTEPWYC